MITTQPEALRDEYHETVDDLENRYADGEDANPESHASMSASWYPAADGPPTGARTSAALVRCLQAHPGSRRAQPVKINSGYRSWARNVEVYRNGKNPTKSRHCSGKAADIEIAGLTGMQIAKLAVDSCGDGIGDTSADIRGRWAKGPLPGRHPC